MKLAVPKKTQTYADVLQAAGLASLVRELTQTEPEIRDGGAEFTVEAPGEVDPSDWPPPSPGYPYIWDSKAEPEPPPGAYLDYRAEIAKRDAYREYQKNLNNKSKAAAAAQAASAGSAPPAPPSPELSIATVLASMRSGWWKDLELQRWLAVPANALAWTRNRLTGLPISVELPRWSNSQFLNPISGKGVHAPKTICRAPKAIPGELSDGWEDWLKLRGIFR